MMFDAELINAIETNKPLHRHLPELCLVNCAEPDLIYEGSGQLFIVNRQVSLLFCTKSSRRDMAASPMDIPLTAGRYAHPAEYYNAFGIDSRNISIKIPKIYIPWPPILPDEYTVARGLAIRTIFSLDDLAPDDDFMTVWCARPSTDNFGECDQYSLVRTATEQGISIPTANPVHTFERHDRGWKIRTKDNLFCSEKFGTFRTLANLICGGGVNCHYASAFLKILVYSCPDGPAHETKYHPIGRRLASTHKSALARFGDAIYKTQQTAPEASKHVCNAMLSAWSAEPADRDVWIQTMCISTERVLRECAGITRPDYINATGRSPHFRNLLKEMHRTRPKFLNHSIDSLCVSWNEVRHNLCHGSRNRPTSTDQYFSHVYKIIDLLNRAFLTFIEYEGPYKDYSSLNWQEKDFSAK
ncbi:MAG: hypothetical protein JJU33_03110 [Phycisphaerales bacterium]|nr:hypothetical protein [Phycisphaerales bacterium]